MVSAISREKFRLLTRVEFMEIRDGGGGSRPHSLVRARIPSLVIAMEIIAKLIKA
jgi:hypothetical protein